MNRAGRPGKVQLFLLDLTTGAHITGIGDSRYITTGQKPARDITMIPR